MDETTKNQFERIVLDVINWTDGLTLGNSVRVPAGMAADNEWAE